MQGWAFMQVREFEFEYKYLCRPTPAVVAQPGS
jgi:hypothetical protein